MVTNAQQEPLNLLAIGELALEFIEIIHLMNGL